MATQIGPKIGIEGEKEYKQQLQQIIRQTKTLDSEMKKTTAAWNENTSALAKNRASAQNTEAKLELLNKKQEVLNNLLSASVEKFGASSAAAQKYQQALNITQGNIATLTQKMKTFGGAEGASDLSVKMADIGTKMQNVGQSMSAIGQKMTTSLTLPLAAAGAAAVKLASDTEEARNKVDVVFGSMSESVKQFASEALNSYGMAEGSALQMASSFGAMASAMGFSEQQSANMSVELTKLAADLASFHNVSLEVAQHSLQGIFTGETEALKKFVGTMSQANLEEFAAKQGQVYSKMSEAEKAMIRYAYVMQATKDAQGDFGRTSDGTANSLRTLQESLKQLGAVLGEQILPIITPIIQKVTEFVQAFASLPEPVQKVIVVTLMLVAVLGPLIMMIGGIVAAIGAAGPALATLGAGIAAFAAGIALGAVLWEAFEEIGRTVNNAVTIVKGAWDILMAVNDRLKSNVNEAVSSIVSYFAELPSRIVKALKDAVQAVKDTFKQMIQNAKKSGADFVSGFIDGIKSKVQPLIDQVKSIAETIEAYLGFSCPDKGALSKYESWMPDFMNGLAKGINQNKGIVTNAIDSLSKSMVLPLDSSASMNMAIAGADGGSVSVGGTSMNVYVDHINDLQDLIRIQNQAQQRYRMGAR